MPTATEKPATEKPAAKRPAPAAKVERAEEEQPHKLDRLIKSIEALGDNELALVHQAVQAELVSRQ